MDTEYNHNWPSYMPAKALALTAVNIFLGYGDGPEKVSAMQILYDELCERVGLGEAYAVIFHAPGMDKNLCDEFMELVE